MALVFLWVQEEARIRAHKIFTWKHLTIWRPVLLGFSQSTGCLFFWIPPWTPFRECWGLAACSGHDVIFVGAAFSQQGPFKATIWLCFGGILWPLCPTGLEKLIPRSRKDSIDRLLSVLLLDRALWEQKFLDYICLTSLLIQENIPSCCCFPYLELH